MSRDYSCRSWFRCWRAHCQPSFLVRIINWSWIRQILLEILVNLGKWPRKLACQSSWMTLKSTSQVDSNWLSSKSKRIPQHSPKNIATFSLSGLISSSFFLFFFLVGQLPNDEISKRSWGRGGNRKIIARISPSRGNLEEFVLFLKGSKASLMCNKDQRAFKNEWINR